MNAAAERILLVESDPDTGDLIARQVLAPLGYAVKVCAEAAGAIQQAVTFNPDLVITDLNLPGLSGKDLLVALNSQGNSVPLIVLAKKGQEADVIQAFRLGASDYLMLPAREAEVVSAVERVLGRVRERRAATMLDRQLKNTNQEMQARVRELTTIFAVGKAVVSITDPRVLCDKIVEGMIYVAGADYGWLLLRDAALNPFLLTSQRNLPEAWAKRMGAPLDDGLSSLVALSGESLAINGEPLKRFKVSALGRSAVVVPIKTRQEVIGLVVIVRKADLAFDKNTQALLEAITDYASISLVNARLFRALQESADAAQAGETSQLETLRTLREQVAKTLKPASYPVELLLAGGMGELTAEQEQALKTVESALQAVAGLVEPELPTGRKNSKSNG